MKKNIIVCLCVICSAFIVGCSEKKVNSFEGNSGQETEVQIEDTNTEESKGVYPNGGRLIEVPMGICVEGVQTSYCRIEMPEEYMFSASYTDENGQQNSDIRTGGDSLEALKEEGVLDDSQYAYSGVILMSLSDDNSKLYFNIYTSDNKTLDSVKKAQADGKEIGTQANPAYYYEPSGEYVTEDMILAYQVNDKILLTINYEGALADKIGIDELAQNIYDLIKVED